MASTGALDESTVARRDLRGSRSRGRNERRLRLVVTLEPGLPATILVDLQSPGQGLISVTDVADPEEKFRVSRRTRIGPLANREVGGGGGDRCRCGGDAIRVIS